MKFLAFSDIHCEFEDFDISGPFPSEVEAVLVAGDIWTKGRSIKKLEAIADWSGVPVIATAGNHCYYGDSIFKSDERMRQAAQDSAFDIRFLNPGTTTVGGCRIIAATLWTDYRLRCPEGPNWAEKHACESVMNDHRRIRWGDGNFRKVSADDLASIHLKHKAYIENALMKNHEGPTLVMTHHAPSELSVKFRNTIQKDDHAYASNLEGLILDHAPDIWLHGHTHHAEHYTIGATRVISNPKGYPGQNPEFDMLKVFDCTCESSPEMDLD